MSIVQTKSLLAKLLATENITVEHRNVPTAAFNLLNRTLILPMWEGLSNDSLDLLIGHEVGHALDTPTEEWENELKKNPNMKSFLNVVEDARIEKRIKRRYPGIRISFRNGYKEFMEKDIFGIGDRDINSMHFVDRLNMFFKAGSLLNVDFSEVEQAMVDEVADCESFGEVITIAKKIYDYSVKEQKRAEEQSVPDELEDSSCEDCAESEESEEGKEDFGEMTSNVSMDSSESENSEDNKEQVEGSPSGSNDDGEKSEEPFEEPSEEPSEEPENKSNERTKFSSNEENDSTPTSETDEAFERNRKIFVNPLSKDNYYAKLPKPIYENIITPSSRVHELLNKYWSVDYVDKVRTEFFNEFLSKNSRYIDMLAKEFEMRKAAKSFNKSRSSSTGDIDVNKIYKYKIDDNLFRKINIVPQGKNHGLVILLDRSGSMGNNMSGSLEQVVVLSMFCKKVGIPFIVYGFGNNDDAFLVDKEKALDRTFTREENEIELDRVYLREYLNSNMNQAQLNNAYKNVIMLSKLFKNGHIWIDNTSITLPIQEYLSSTPLNESLIAMAPIVKKFKETKKLEIVSTVIIQDGDSDSRHLYVNTNGSKQYIPYNQNLIISEKLNGKLFQFKFDRLTLNQEITKYYVEYTQSKVIGFYIVDKNHTTKICSDIFRQRNGNHDYRWVAKGDLKDIRNELKKNRFLDGDRGGYDKFFYVTGSHDLETESDLLDVEDGLSVNKLKTAFLKNNLKKINNRALVNRLISLISK